LQAELIKRIRIVRIQTRLALDEEVEKYADLCRRKAARGKIGVERV